MKKVLSAFVVVFALFGASSLFASDPTHLYEWDEFTMTFDGTPVSADEYEIAVTDPAQSGLPSANAVVHRRLFVPGTARKILLADLMKDTSGNALPTGSYRIQIRAKVGSNFTAWNAGLTTSYNALLPGTVPNPRLNPGP